MSTLMAREVREGLVRLRWTPEALDEMLRRGDLDADRRYEILNGELYEKMGHNWPHAFAVSALQVLFGRLEPTLLYVSGQLPLRIGQDLLEPDLKVVRGSLFGRKEMPTSDEALLVIEVLDTTYATDLHIKLPIYATASVPVYWIVDLNRQRIEVFRGPTGDTYEIMNVYEDGALLAQAFKGCPAIAVSDIFVSKAEVSQDLAR